MSIKTILVPLDGSPNDTLVLNTALVVADRFGAHIDVLHVMPQPSDTAPFMFDRMSAKLKNTVMQEVENRARGAAAAVRDTFDDYCTQHNVTLVQEPTVDANLTATWHEEFGRVSEVLVRYGRLTDVIATARPSKKATTVRRSPLGENLEAMLLRCGRPLLMVPPDWTARRVQHAAIGWNESLEACRALAVTMPWLEQVASVTVIVSKNREPRVSPLIAYLGWHGVEANVEILDDRGSSVGNTILNICSAVAADFLIVGGFSHARARELLFGGVTRYLLKQANLLTVMVH